MQVANVTPPFVWRLLPSNPCDVLMRPSSFGRTCWAFASRQTTFVLQPLILVLLLIWGLFRRYSFRCHFPPFILSSFCTILLWRSDVTFAEDSCIFKLSPSLKRSRSEQLSNIQKAPFIWKYCDSLLERLYFGCLILSEMTGRWTFINIWTLFLSAHVGAF